MNYVTWSEEGAFRLQKKEKATLQALYYQKYNIISSPNIEH